MHSQLLKLVVLSLFFNLGCSSIGETSKTRYVASPAQPGRPQIAIWQGHNIYYEEFGHGSEDAIVFIHGWACDGTFWDYQIPEFTARQRVIRIDLPGHGKSDKPYIKYTIDQMATAVNTVLENAGVKNGVLVGHSLGGIVVRQVYRKFPEKIAALVVVDSSLGPWSKETTDYINAKLKELEGREYKKVAGEMIDTMFISSTPEELRNQIKTKMLSRPQHVLVNALRGMNNSELYKTDAVRVPVLHFRVKSTDLDPKNEKYLRTFMRDLTYQEWDDTGHFLMIENHQKFNQVLQKFLLTKRI